MRSFLQALESERSLGNLKIYYYSSGAQKRLLLRKPATKVEATSTHAPICIHFAETEKSHKSHGMDPFLYTLVLYPLFITK